MLLTKTNTTAKKEYYYDKYLLLSQVSETVLTDGKSFTFGYQYDSYGRLAKKIYTNTIGETENSTLNYVYDDYSYPVKSKLLYVNLYKPIPYTYDYIRSTYIPSILKKTFKFLILLLFFFIVIN